jgi:putative endonuclease
VKTYAWNFRLDRSAQIAGQSAMPSFVYILAAQNPDGRTITYVGWTLDLERRLAEHNGAKTSRGAKKSAQKGAQKGAKSTRGRAWALVYAEKHRTRKGAMRREFVLKNDRKFRSSLRS